MDIDMRHRLGLPADLKVTKEVIYTAIGPDGTAIRWFPRPTSSPEWMWSTGRVGGNRSYGSGTIDDLAAVIAKILV